MKKISGWQAEDGTWFSTREEAARHEAGQELLRRLGGDQEPEIAATIVDKADADPAFAREVSRLFLALVPPGERRARRADAGQKRGPREVKAA